VGNLQLEEKSVTNRTTAIFLIGALLVTGATGLLADAPKKQATYSVRGKVTGLLPGHHLIVSTQVPNGPTTTTQDDGTYVLPGLGPGKYDIRLSEAPYKITPSSKVVAIVNSDVNGVDFQAQKILTPESKKGGAKGGTNR